MKNILKSLVSKMMNRGDSAPPSKIDRHGNGFSRFYSPSGERFEIYVWRETAGPKAGLVLVEIYRDGKPLATIQEHPDNIYAMLSTALETLTASVEITGINS